MPILDLSAMMTTALVAMRIAAMLAMTPMLTAFPVPAQFRLILVIVLSYAVAGALPPMTAAVPRTPGAYLAASTAELVMGLLLAVGVFAAFSAFAFAGRVLDIQIGFGIGQVYDPVSRTETPILTSVFSYAALAVFFLLDGHHALLRAVAYTFQAIPPGQFTLARANAGNLVALTGRLFSLGFMLIAPVTFCILVVEAGLAMLARGLPQVNMFVISLPVKIVVGLLVLSFWARHMPASMERIYALIFQVWNGVLQ